MNAHERPRRFILVVDDEPMISKLLRIVLEGDGYEVVVADDGRVALDRVAERCPDLVILDIDMPRMGGIELIAFIRRCPMTATTPIVVLTLRDTTHDRVDVSALGILAFLRKPFRQQQLQDALASAGWVARSGPE